MDNSQAYKTKITNPSQVVIEQILLTSSNGFSIDLRANVVQIQINESLKDVFLSGSILITEALNFIRHVPITGNEYLTITFYTPSAPPITAEFLITKISRRIMDGMKTVTYLLHFVSPQYMYSITTKFSKSFENMSYTEMAESIFKDYLKDSKKSIVVTPTAKKKKITLPFMNPVEAINYLCSKTIDEVNNANYIFYETLDNEFILKPLYDLSNPPIQVAQEYISFLPDISEVSLLQDFSRITELEILESANSKKNIQNGLYSGKVQILDMTNKKIDEFNYNYNDLFEKTKHLNENGIVPKYNQPYSDLNFSNYKVYPKSQYVYDNIEDLDEYFDVVPNRSFQLNSADAFRIAIRVWGDSRRRVGECVKVLINSPQAVKKSEDKFDAYLSGYYIIEKIQHNIELDNYTTNIILVKDSVPTPYPDVKNIDGSTE